MRFVNVRPLARIVICLGVVLISGPSGHTAESKRNRKQIEEMTRLQILLDNCDFGPGKIDGKDGEFTRKAIMLFKRSQGYTGSIARSKSPIDTSGLDLASVDPVFTTYVVAKGDFDNVGELPISLAAQAKLKWLPYQSVAEAIAEKFHCDIDFLKELNPKLTESLKEGDQITVPNVNPFELGALNAFKPGLEAAGKDTDESGGQDKKSQSEHVEAAKGASKEETPPLSLFISTKEKILEVYSGEKLIAAFPVTVGSQQTASPIGHWTVKGIAKLPNFRYDLKMLNEGERSSTFHILPPGPNNPAGVIWIELNKKGIGIHGTSDPDSLGRNASHGCIRLANWDIAKLARMLKPGVAVVVE